MSARDEAAGGVGRPAMTPEERDAFNAWWNSLSAKGDPLRRPWLVNEAFHAAWNRRSPSPHDQASSAMLGALEEKGALLSAEQVMAEVYAAAHPAVAKVLRDAFEGRGFSPKTETGCVAGVALRDLALEPVTMYRRRVAKAEAPIQLRRSAGIETGENG